MWSLSEQCVDRDAGDTYCPQWSIAIPIRLMALDACFFTHCFYTRVSMAPLSTSRFFSISRHPGTRQAANMTVARVDKRTNQLGQSLIISPLPRCGSITMIAAVVSAVTVNCCLAAASLWPRPNFHCDIERSPLLSERDRQREYDCVCVCLWRVSVCERRPHTPLTESHIVGCLDYCNVLAPTQQRRQLLWNYGNSVRYTQTL